MTLLRLTRCRTIKIQKIKNKLQEINLYLLYYLFGSRARWPPKCQKQGWASRPEFRVLALGLAADTRLLGKTARL